uniref:Uncharacterized protein n=1 Tax=Aureoumbra lagunensis TaxID=44058 RepID=A0A7S3K5C0_9STRA|mmetsp:Transcript_11626/g.15801  ORF Transcript_11626/g.15801 Transcript_11626/m.15801 type:complete len:206 (+) Transcript_11626:327-944(+)
MNNKRPYTDNSGGLGDTKRVKPDATATKESFKCHVCGETRELSETETGPSVCVKCDGDYGCFECAVEQGGWCGNCEEFTCFNCPGYPTACDECYEQFCAECGNFKPGKNRTMRCYSCQPWWQKNKPAGAFCRDCGSQRGGANFCEDCGARICEMCESFQCTSCRETFYCDECNRDDVWCAQCGEDLVCTECCEGHGESEGDAEGE